MKFEVGDRAYEIDVDDLTTAECRIIHKKTGLGLWAFGRGLAEAVPDALIALVFIAKKRNMEAVRWEDLDDLKLVPLGVAISASLFTPAAEDGEPADPPPPEPEPEPEPTSPPSGDGTIPSSE